MITQKEIRQLSKDLGISEREARFMLAVEAGDIDGDITSGPKYDYVLREQSRTQIPLQESTEAPLDKNVASVPS